MRDHSGARTEKYNRYIFAFSTYLNFQNSASHQGVTSERHAPLLGVTYVRLKKIINIASSTLKEKNSPSHWRTVLSSGIQKD